MSRVIRTPEAKNDLKELWNYIADFSEERADSYLRMLDEKMQTLAQFPLMGKECAELLEGLRSFPVNNYVIFYRPIDNGIEVIRVLHGARDIESLFEL
ncbi:type II toxin-antitoxin system RelE/ParE family toxin [Brasilonema sp. UFV-L1]|uniref:type II toxin-antitoxin system RelE/ParE family toxin n=1 Tax=Brasilonema sp. UFV-L1 TaxID=2234130 RepID=UPI00145E66E3|nr:type II toxin-antitoxin system RelE/ParE family toxin [Brasilonema sp. UFV-L1]NMG08316.1 type II toxin-antitoxin system RelE/ParE family toxin [Brasilonema sp. UFV-L1]